MSVDSWSSPFADSLNFLKFAHFSNSLDLLHGQIANVFLVYCSNYLVSLLMSVLFSSVFFCHFPFFYLAFPSAFSVVLYLSFSIFLLSFYRSSAIVSLSSYRFSAIVSIASHLFFFVFLLSSKFGRDLQTFFYFHVRFSPYTFSVSFIINKKKCYLTSFFPLKNI